MSGRTERITIRITHAEKQRISGYSRRHHRTDADWARLILMDSCPDVPCETCGHPASHHHSATQSNPHPRCLACANEKKQNRHHPYLPERGEGTRAA